jgi:hypothetical protein
LDEKLGPIICFLQNTNTSHWQRYTQDGSKRLENNVPTKWKPKASGISYTHIRQIDFKPKLVRRDKEDHYTVVKGTIHQQ